MRLLEDHEHDVHDIRRAEDDHSCRPARVKRKGILEPHNVRFRAWALEAYLCQWLSETWFAGAGDPTFLLRFRQESYHAWIQIEDSRFLYSKTRLQTKRVTITDSYWLHAYWWGEAIMVTTVSTDALLARQLSVYGQHLRGANGVDTGMSLIIHGWRVALEIRTHVEFHDVGDDRFSLYACPDVRRLIRDYRKAHRGNQGVGWRESDLPEKWRQRWRDRGPL